MFFRTKAEQDCTRAHKKWRETNSGLHLTAVGCSARSLRGNAKKKALGRTSEPRPKPSTVAPISRRSPRLYCTNVSKAQISRCRERCSNQTAYRDLQSKFAFVTLWKKTWLTRAPVAHKWSSFFKEKYVASYCAHDIYFLMATQFKKNDSKNPKWERFFWIMFFT